VDYQAALQGQQTIPSMSREGDCWDIAPKESFFGTLKCELGLHGLRPSREQAHRRMFEHIELLQNRQRLHSSLGYLSPAAFEAADRARAA
jgi:transposase InsO family protein